MVTSRDFLSLLSLLLQTQELWFPKPFCLDPFPSHDGGLFPSAASSLAFRALPRGAPQPSPRAVLCLVGYLAAFLASNQPPSQLSCDTGTISRWPPFPSGVQLSLVVIFCSAKRGNHLTLLSSLFHCSTISLSTFRTSTISASLIKAKEN